MALYDDFFAFSKDPFSITPDPQLLYPSAKHRQALAHLKYGLSREGGFMLLTGEVGTGKTTLTRMLLEQAPANFRLAYVLNAHLSKQEVLRSICEELQVEVSEPPANDQSCKPYVDALNRNLLQAHAALEKTLVVIEEAQNLDAEVLETLRLLTNLETADSKLLHILLVGQPELLELLSQDNLRQLDQRVVSRFDLMPLSRSECGEYLQYRLERVGCKRKIFSAGAVSALFRLSRGIPRKINLIAERALMGAYSKDLHQVREAHVKRAYREVFGARSTPIKRNLFWPMATLSLLVISLLAWQYGYVTIPPTDRSAPPSAVTQPPAAPEQITALQQTDSAAEVVASSALISAVSPSTTLENEFSRLLSLWDIPLEGAVPSSLEEMCLWAIQHQHFCLQRTGLMAADILALNLPSLLLGSDKPVLLESVGDLADASEVGSQDLVTLWRPPAGYFQPLRRDDKNTTVVNWLIPLLAEYDPSLDNLITGGLYSAPLIEAVRGFQYAQGLPADGVLGPQTIIRIQQLHQSAPVLSDAAPERVN